MIETNTKDIGRLEWRPNPKQAAFLSIPPTIKEALYGGGAGSGKSDVLLMYGIAHKLHENPRFKQVFMRRTHAELRNEIIPRSREIYTKFGATLNKSDMAWTFPRMDQYGSGMSNAGAMVFLGMCEDESDVHKYDSMEISLYTPDEITSLTEYIYLYIAFERNRSPKDSGLPSITRAAGMPGGIGHTFVKKRFIDPYPDGGKVIVGKGGNKRIYIHATQSDNKDHIDPSYEQSLKGRPEAEMKAKLYGDWSAYLGQVFDEFRDRQYPDEPDNALHVIPSFEIPSWWPRIIVGDWGFAAMTYICYAAISPYKRVYIYREQSFLKTKITEWAPHVKVNIDADRPRVVKFCRSIGQDRGQDQTIQQQISEALGYEIELTNNSPGSRVAGKLLLHEYLRWKPKPVMPEAERAPYREEHSLWLLRNRGEAEQKAYINSFAPSEIETNIPKLQIFLDKDAKGNVFGGCPLLIDAIKACSYDRPRNDKPAEDVAEFSGDDPYDTIRYICDASERYFEESANEFLKIQKQEYLVQTLEHDRDWTAFYRNSLRDESVNRMQSVSRYRHH